MHAAKIDFGTYVRGKLQVPEGIERILGRLIP